MNKISIAIIDDESLVRLGIKSSVEWENYGYEIIGEADNGQNGLEMIQQKQPDIVLLDICMPVMDGIEVLKRLQQMEIDCKVIILSCHDDFHFVKEAMKNGASRLEPAAASLAYYRYAMYQAANAEDFTVGDITVASGRDDKIRLAREVWMEAEREIADLLSDDGFVFRGVRV